MNYLYSLVVLLAVNLVIAGRPDVHRKAKSNGRLEQNDVDQLFQRLDSVEPTGRPFVWTDGNYYKSEGKDAGKIFYDLWKMGDFLNKTSPFTLYNYETRKITFKLFQVFYFSNNINTFFEIAEWAKHEINALQFVYVITAAIMHRDDMDHIRLPKLYQVLPHYFLTPEIVLGINKAAILGYKERSYDVNNTGHEYSWYKGQVMQTFKAAPQWNRYDSLTRMSYFSEDIMLADYMAKTVIALAPWIYQEKFYSIPRKGEHLYSVYKHLLARYNLERYANDLPPVRPLEFSYYIKSGYNPHVGSLDGRPFIARPDKFIPLYSYPDGIHRLIVTKRRYDKVTDLLSYTCPINESYVEIENDYRGLNRLGELVFGSSHPLVRKLYKPYQYQVLATLDAALTASHSFRVEGGVLSNFLTEVRDPLYYRMLATVNEVFGNYFSKLPPYTVDELVFPGVKLTDFQIGPLETYFENHKFDISNVIPLKSQENFAYTAYKHRLQHKPFMFNMTVDSQHDADVAVRIFISPRLDASNRPLSTEEQLKSAAPYYFTHLKLKKGWHLYPADSDRGFYSSSHSSEHEYSSTQTHFSPKMERCLFPRNLILPKGGKPFTMFVVLSPVESSDSWGWNPCGWNFLKGVNQFVDFPTDRRINPADLEHMENMFVRNINIEHKDYYY